jgi:cytoskeletal protein CcmA (bactofilin family)
MKNFKYTFVYLALSLAGVAAVALPVFAGPVLRSGESVSVEADQVVEGDIYAAGGSVSISGAIEGDAYVTGGTVTVNAPVSQDVVIVGGTVQIHAAVGDDVRIVGGEVIIADVIEGDLVVVAGAVRILSTAQVNGDLIFAGGDIEIKGPISGSVFGAAGTVRVDSTIGGTLQVTTEQGLTLGDRAEILGDVVYRGGNEIARATGAVVVGDIQTEQLEVNSAAALEAAAAFLVALLFGALTIYLIFKSFLIDTVESAERSFGVNGLIGLGVLIGIPFVALILMFTILGMLVGLILLFAYLCLLIITWIVAGAVLGSIIFRRISKGSSISVLSVVAGVLLFEFLFLVPYLGPLLAFAVYVIVLGTLSERLYRAVR